MMDKKNYGQHISQQFNEELEDVRNRVLAMGGLVEDQIRRVMRALVERDAHLLVVPSAWVAGPEKLHHWRTLVTARALENTVYVAATGQPGPRYTGHSLLVGPGGETLAEAGDGAGVVAGRVDLDVLGSARRTNPSLANRRM